MDSLPDIDKLVRVTVRDGREFLALRIINDDGERDFWQWAAVDEADAPECWTDGACWAVNENRQPSMPVVAWRYAHLPRLRR